MASEKGTMVWFLSSPYGLLDILRRVCHSKEWRHVDFIHCDKAVLVFMDEQYAL